MIRLITFTSGGRAYLNFMGNEFGHPEVNLQTPTVLKTSSSCFWFWRFILVSEGWVSNAEQ